ncbi:MAG: hypothetical protein HYU71_05670 [Bacteroidetes bacterium]|nr:hypothetical protein [Bacteroidota bacterium]
MKLIKLIFFSVLSLFVVASFIGILLPSHVLVSRAVDIVAVKDSIKPYIGDIQQWKKWMDGMEQASVIIHSPVKADIGTTEVEITSITDSSVVSTWTPKKGIRQTSTVRIIGNSAQNQVVVQWQFEQQLPWYPWERLGSMMNDKILGTMMETNLNNLRKLAERN